MPDRRGDCRRLDRDPRTVGPLQHVDRRWSGRFVAALFTDDATLTFIPAAGEPRRYRGRHEIRSLADGPAGRFVHATTDDLITIHGDRATRLCTLIVLRPSPDGGTAVTNRGR